MKILSWNIRGMRNPRAIHNLKFEVRKNSSNILFISETKCKKERIEIVKKELGFDLCFWVDSMGKSGGLALVWFNQLDITMLSFSKGHIDISVEDINVKWRLTGFYGNPDQGKRKESWTLLERLSKVSNLPWIIGGDFNEIMFAEEKEGGAPRKTRLMDSFRETIDNCILVD